MLDINLLRTNKELVKENIKKKFQDAKLPLVDEVVELEVYDVVLAGIIEKWKKYIFMWAQIKVSML